MVVSAQPHRGVSPEALTGPTRTPRRSLADVLRRDPLHTAITVAIDVAAAALAVAIALAWGAGHVSQLGLGWLPWLFVPLVIATLGAGAMYRRILRRNFLDEIGPVETAVALASLILLTLFLFDEGAVRPGAVAVRIWVCAALIIPGARLVRAVGQRHLRKRYRAAAPTLVVGNDRLAHQLIARMTELPEYGLQPVGILDAAAPEPVPTGELSLFPDVPYLGTPEDFADALRATDAEELIISSCELPDDRLLKMVRTAHRRGMRVWVVPRLYDAIGARARVEHFGGLPLLVLPKINPRGWQFAVKHGMDRLLAGIGLLIISPLFLTLALLVRLSSPGPIFFRQKRVGRNGKPFDCLKFRSMRPPRESDAAFELKSGAAPGGVEGVDRRTRIGKLMRATSLDELPQLLNVVRGDMSLVGPRPERPEFVELFEMQIRRYGERHRVKAGVTGWAQVHGLRGQTSIADRAEWDNYYIENWSLWLDIKILALTIPAVFRASED
jgi:exopolysaccharide biosynthesis polyprenyl glycosylphosphotransferase